MYGGDCEVMQQSSRTPTGMMMMLSGGTSTAGMSLPGGMATGGPGGGSGINMTAMGMNNMGISGVGVAPGSMGMAAAVTMSMGFTPADLLFTSSPPPGTHMGFNGHGQLSTNVNGGFMSSPFHQDMVGVSGSLGLQPIIPKAESAVLHSHNEEELESGGSGASGQLDGLSCGEEHETADHSLYSSQQQKPQQLMLHQDEQQQQDAQNPQGQKKKRYHRHSTQQIREMEALFKECPHPDDKQRMRLSQELGLKPRQVKFWFQNRRTQMKAQQDRSDNVLLRAENERLKSDNFRLQAAIRNVVCPNCGGPAILGEMSLDEQHLRLENARLKEELDRLSSIAARYGGRASQPPSHAINAAAPMLLMPPSLDLDMGIYSRHFQGQHIQHQHNSHNHSGSMDMPLPLHPSSNCQFPLQQPLEAPCDFILIPEHDKQMVLDTATAAAAELLTICRTNEPLWRRSNYSTIIAAAGSGEAMVLEDHPRMFQFQQMTASTEDPAAAGARRIEGTRDRGHVMMNSINLVDAFFDVNKYTQLFPSIVSNVKTLQVISSASSSGTGNGSLHLMYAELLLPSPLVPTREAYFFRYCQHHPDEGVWLMVDFPANSYAAASSGEGGINIPSTGYNRKPSGCVFQDMPNGYSMVTWVEQAEVEDKGPFHPIFNDFVRTGAAFGATRWLAVLQQQCDRLASAMARTVSDLGVIPSPEARKNMMRLSQRMIRTFCSNISLQLQGPHQQHQPWTALSDSPDDAVRITTRKNTDAGQPSGVILTAVSTIWLPHSHVQVFELLSDESKRVQMDVLSNGNSLHEVAHIANGSHHKNCVSLFRVNSSSNSSQNVELMLQESHTHPTGGSMVVYANMDVDAVQVAMSGDDPSYIPLLPTGFVVVPARRPLTTDTNLIAGTDTISQELPPSYSSHSTAEAAGCLLTVGVQVLASAVPSAKLSLSSVNAINNHICNAVKQITAALGPATACDAVNSSSPPQSLIQVSAIGTCASTADN